MMIHKALAVEVFLEQKFFRVHAAAIRQVGDAVVIEIHNDRSERIDHPPFSLAFHNGGVGFKILGELELRLYKKTSITVHIAPLASYNKTPGRAAEPFSGSEFVLRIKIIQRATGITDLRKAAAHIYHGMPVMKITNKCRSRCQHLPAPGDKAKLTIVGAHGLVAFDGKIFDVYLVIFYRCDHPFYTMVDQAEPQFIVVAFFNADAHPRESNRIHDIDPGECGRDRSEGQTADFRSTS